MRLLNFIPITLFLIIAHLTAAKPAPNPFPEPLPIDELISLEKRQNVLCPYRNGCLCDPGALGVYCWGCGVVSDPGSGAGDFTGWVFQCGGNGNCCSFGPADDCADGAAPRCG